MTQKLIDTSKIFWKILYKLEELKNPVPLSEFLDSYNIQKDNFFIFLEQAHYYGLNVNLQDDEETKVIFPLSWHREFDDVVVETKSYFRELASDIQSCVESGKVCLFKFKNGSEMGLFPWRLLFLDNKLSLIAEETKSKRLLTIELEEVEDIEVHEKNYNSLFSRLEVEDFINAMRAVSGSDERLIMKIQLGNEISMPNHLVFLGNPYTTTNQYGEIIWAASVEPSDLLYEWLFSIKDKVDILDPTSIQAGFNKFCDFKKAA